MGCCFERISKCANCYCFICASCGVFYHMHEEGNLNLDIVKNWCRYTSEVIAEDLTK